MQWIVPAGARRVALSELLPNFSARLGDTRQVVNLEAFGIPVAEPGLPRVVGPFNVFDVRVFLSQAIFDLRALHEARAEGAQRRSSASLQQEPRVIWYRSWPPTCTCRCWRPSARAESARAQRDTAQALYTQAQNLRQSGIIAGIDVRARARSASVARASA